MNITNEKIGNILILCPEGQINSSNAAGIEADLMEHINKGERSLVLDLSHLQYISSAGLRVVLVLAKRLREEGGRVVLGGLLPHVYEVFNISGFLSILTVVETREAALEKLS